MSSRRSLFFSMVEKHQSSILTFAGIYLAVSLIVGGAIFFLHRSHQRELQKAILASEKALKRASESPPATPSQPKSKPTVQPKPPSAKANLAKAKAKPDRPPKDPLQPKKPTESEKPPSPDAGLDSEIEKMYPIPEIRPLLEIVQNWKSVPQNAFPPFVKIRVPVEFQIKDRGTVVGKGKLPAGSSMIPLRLQDDTLTLSSSVNSNFSVNLSTSDTDFRERIQARYDKFVKDQTNGVLVQRRAEKQRRLGLIEKESALSKYNDGEDPRFDPVKASIRRGEAGFFQMESARKWRWAGKESIEGEDFDAAFVMMITESAFGTSERELKALIQNEKVVSWIDVSTGEKL